MRIGVKAVAGLMFVVLSGASAFAQRHEIGLSLGGLTTNDRKLMFPPSSVEIGGSLTYYANYAYRLADLKAVSIHLEFPLAATPSTDLNSSNVFVPRNYASLFFTPGLKFKFLPKSKLSPYAAVGGGLGRFEESESRINNQPNTGRRGTNRGAFDFGGGLDVSILRFLSIRGELRDFVTGNPNFNFPVSGSKQHNLLTSGGIVLRF